MVKQAEKLKSREMNEGWMKNDEGWMKDEQRMMNDEGWWFQAVQGFLLLTVGQMNKQNTFVNVELLSWLNRATLWI